MMFRFDQICLRTLLLLAYLQIVESRAGGGDDSISDYSWSDSSSYDYSSYVYSSYDSGSSNSSSSNSRSYNSTNCSNCQKLVDDLFHPLIIFIYILVFAYSCYDLQKQKSAEKHKWSSEKKSVDEKHKEISEKLKNSNKNIWKENEIIPSVNKSFIALQKAWSTQDLDFIERKLTKDLFIKWRDILIGMKYRNERNLVSEIVINKIKFVKLEVAKMKFTVFIDANVKDVTVNIQSGKILKDQSGNFREFWTYVWGVDEWLLMEINQERESKKFL